MNTLDDASAQDAARQELRRAQLVIDAHPEEALGHLVEAKRLDPKNPDIVLSLAKTEVRLQMYPDAIITLQRLSELGATTDHSLALLSMAHRQLGHYEEAQKRATQSLEINQDNRLAREILADCLRAAKEWRKAFDQLNILAADSSVLPDQIVARLNVKIATCLYNLKQYHEVWEITTTLKENGYSNATVEKLYALAEAAAKREIESDMGKPNIGQRLFLRMVDKFVLRAALFGRRRGMNSLRKRTKLREMAAEEVASHAERRADEAGRLAKEDKLTGLPNRLCYEQDYLPKFQPGVSVGVIAFDADKFKLINDFHGHDGGDKALLKISAVAASIFRHPQSNVFRFGGEEFVAIVFGDRSTTERVAETLRAEMERRGASELAAEGMPLKKVDEATGEPVARPLTVSVGVAMWPEDFAEPEMVLKAADLASYQAKNGGRNKLVVYMAGMAGPDGKSLDGTTVVSGLLPGGGGPRPAFSKKATRVRAKRERVAAPKSISAAADPADVPDLDPLEELEAELSLRDVFPEAANRTNALDPH